MDSISNVMQRGLGFGTKITNNKARTKNPITRTTLAITATTTAGNNETETETTTAADKQQQEY
jgi:hypothetical protein